MRHDWVFEVLRDLKSYALANGLPALAAKAEEALMIARAEVAAQPATDSGSDIEPLGLPVGRRTH